ncbi:MAG TPA: DUF6588 family protein [Mucilaginibacter sp.]|nr:DUF6588 family protein [Mucilaginibacter sp.]
MKKIYLLFSTLFLTTVVLTANAQDGFSDLIKSSPANATRLIEAYGAPLFKGFGVGMNSGWTNTAKPKGLLHFDLRVTATAAFTPVSDKTFDVTKIGLNSNVTPSDPNQTIAQTIGGNQDIDGPTMDIKSNGQTVSQFRLPSGKLPFIPSPQLQLTIGLIKQTDVTLRLIPKVSIGDAGSVSMLGFGIKHNLMQYFSGPTERIIPFDLSVMLAYSRLNLSASLDVKPENGTVHDPSDPNRNEDFNNQHTDGHFSSFLAEAIISKKLLFFTPFLAVGYNTASTDLGIIGNYPVTTGNNTYTVFTNPVSINQNSLSGFRADIGFQLNLGIQIFASASLANYKSVNAGVGFGF